jgi:hypothetical protein
MLKKGKLWYADWEISRGVRKRKGCKTKRAALRLAARMRREVQETKKAQASRSSRRSPRHGQTLRVRVSTRPSRRGFSRRKRATAGYRKSAPTPATN